MIAVAGRTWLRFASGARGRDGSDPGMITAPGLQALSNRNMAIQAFGVARLLADLVTGQTFRQTFKLRMRTRKRAG